MTPTAEDKKFAAKVCRELVDLLEEGASYNALDVHAQRAADDTPSPTCFMLIVSIMLQVMNAPVSEQPSRLRAIVEQLETP